MKKQRTALGSQLRMTRLKLELTFREVAKASGVSAARLCELESGEHQNPSLSTIRALTKLYKLDPLIWFT
jgi:transcriptional regulator with XRE-family HTH domain